MPSESPSSSTQAWAPGPAWRSTLSRAAATAASTSAATSRSTTTGSAGTATPTSGRSCAVSSIRRSTSAPSTAAQVGRVGDGVGCSGARDEAAQRALLLGGDDRQLDRVAPDLVTAAVDVGERLEDPVVDDPGDPLALVQPLALEQHLLLALEPGAGEVDRQPDQPSEQHDQHDVVHRRLGGVPPDLDQVGDHDDGRGREPASHPRHHGSPGHRPGGPDGRDGELPGGDGLRASRPASSRGCPPPRW